MLQKLSFIVVTGLVTGAAHAQAPTEAQVKEALYDRYAISQSAGQLRNALNSEVGVGACQPEGSQTRCEIENKKLGTTIPMLFEFDPRTKKWTFVKEIRD